METWKAVKGYEGYYEVSDCGNVRGVDRMVKTSILHSDHRLRAGKTLKKNLKKNGYYTVDLCKEGEVKSKSVHRLVAEAFIPNPDNLAVVNHKNGVKTDNSVGNLEWVTYKENHWHARENDLLVNIGRYHVKSVQCVETGQIFEAMTDAAKWLLDGKDYDRKKLSRVVSNMRRCINGYTPRAYGYHWKELSSEGSTTIPEGSTRKCAEMGGSMAGKVMDEDIV